MLQDLSMMYKRFNLIKMSEFCKEFLFRIFQIENFGSSSRI